MDQIKPKRISLINQITKLKKTVIILQSKVCKLESENKFLKENLFEIEQRKKQLEENLNIIKWMIMNHQENTPIKKDPSVIKEIKPLIQLTKLHSNDVTSLIELPDKRIATGSKDNSIIICSVNYNTKKFEKKIIKLNAHNGWISSLCHTDSPKKYLISSSYDNTIKIWEISSTELTLKKTLKEHTNSVYKVIVLTNQRFASCSLDSAVKIWSLKEPFHLITTLQHNDLVYSILHLASKDQIVSSCEDKSLYFWNLKHNTIDKVINGYCSYSATHMIKLQNDNIAISSNANGNKIVIIDTKSYTIINEIDMQHLYNPTTSLWVLNNKTIITGYKNNFIQVDNKEGTIVFKTNAIQNFGGFYGIITVNNGQFIICNCEKGISIFQLYYEG